MNASTVSRTEGHGSGCQLAGLIPAGGAGSRFGGPKAWARMPDGRTFLEACAASLRGAGAGRIVATLPPGSVDPSIAGVDSVPLPRSGIDMFASITIGLKKLVEEGDWIRVAILPVDHPLVRPASISAIAACGDRVAAPRHRGKGGHPVVIHRSVAEGIADGRRTGPTLRDVLRPLGVTEIAVDDPGTVANCNTPEALARAVRDRS